VASEAAEKGQTTGAARAFIFPAPPDGSMADERNEDTGIDTATEPVLGRGPDRRDLADNGELAVSTLFTAQNVRDYLDTAEGRETAIEWCRGTGISRVFLETYRDRYRADRATLAAAREAFREAGLDVSGCITPTEVGRSSTGWDPITCYTAAESQEHLEDVFRFTASIFDEIMVDDFLFTDCECEECVAARGDRSWGADRSDLMLEVSRECVLGAAAEENPDAEVIIKFPEWYDDFQERGYVVDAQSEAFDTVWVGTEIRDYDHERWGGKPAYGAYYLQRWLGEVGGEKTAGGWFDTLGTTEDTYLEQAAATVLGGADEATLFAYGLLQEDTGPPNVEYLREELPGVFELARTVEGREPWGVAAPKPPHSEPFEEPQLFSFLGMCGLPLVPTTEFDPDAPASVATPYLLGERDVSDRLAAALEAGNRLVVTAGLADRLVGDPTAQGARRLETGGEPASLLERDRTDLRELREYLLEPLDVGFDAPPWVAVHLFGREDPVAVVQNCSDEGVAATLSVPWDPDPRLTLPTDADVGVTPDGDGTALELPGRSLVVL